MLGKAKRVLTDKEHTAIGTALESALARILTEVPEEVAHRRANASDKADRAVTTSKRKPVGQA